MKRQQGDYGLRFDNVTSSGDYQSMQHAASTEGFTGMLPLRRGRGRNTAILNSLGTKKEICNVVSRRSCSHVMFDANRIEML